MNGSKFSDYEQVLRRAVVNNNLEDIKFLLKIKKIDINKQDDNLTNGKTALHWAVIKNHVDCVRVLLEHNADKHILDYNKKMSPVDYAKQNNCKEILELFGIKNEAFMSTTNVSFSKTR